MGVGQVRGRACRLGKRAPCSQQSLRTVLLGCRVRQLRELPRSQMMISWATLKTLRSAVAWGGGGVGGAFVGKQAA